MPTVFIGSRRPIGSAVWVRLGVKSQFQPGLTSRRDGGPFHLVSGADFASQIARQAFRWQYAR